MNRNPVETISTSEFAQRNTEKEILTHYHDAAAFILDQTVINICTTADLAADLAAAYLNSWNHPR